MVHLARSTVPWKVGRDDEEMPWRDSLGHEGFLDFVARTSQATVTVECKKTEADVLTFLAPRGADHTSQDDMTRDTRCLSMQRLHHGDGAVTIFAGCWWPDPQTPEAAFCVVGRSPRERLLERDAQSLIRATDAYAGRAMRGLVAPHHQREVRDTPIFPVLVTNAKLFVARYDPTVVSLESGHFEELDEAGIVPVEVVRFRKAFLSDRDLGSRTVFVVRATAFAGLLGRLHTTAQGGHQLDPTNYPL